MKTFILVIIGVITTVHGQCSIDEATGEAKCTVFTDWKSEGEIRWAPDCAINIEGNDLKTVPNVSDNQKCGELCLQDDKCTHYTFTKTADDGSCDMKAKVRKNGEEPKKSPGAFCGYIETRTDNLGWVGK